jgi:hypothetical protein
MWVALLDDPGFSSYFCWSLWVIPICRRSGERALWIPLDPDRAASLVLCPCRAADLGSRLVDRDGLAGKSKPT